MKRCKFCKKEISYGHRLRSMFSFDGLVMQCPDCGIFYQMEKTHRTAIVQSFVFPIIFFGFYTNDFSLMTGILTLWFIAFLCIIPLVADYSVASHGGLNPKYK